jgi:ribosomal protein S18 acetylase RimI-like enzyme
MNDKLIFKPIDLHRHSSLCVKFRADSYACSFGSAQIFWDRFGVDGQKYLDMLARGGREYSYHAWENDEIVGQIELLIPDDNNSSGHVQLYCIVPEKRGAGRGVELDHFAMNLFRECGRKNVTLTVSPTNKRALSFYKKLGWKNLGQNVDELSQSKTGMSVCYMTKVLD